MGIIKNILIDGKEVPFKASAAVPRLYRLKFSRDIYMDFEILKDHIAESDEEPDKSVTDEEKTALEIKYLEIYENIAYIMAKHADPENVPDTPEEWLEQFSIFTIYVILPQIISLWNRNNETQVESKKNPV